jgi:hypothetical protein
MSEAKSSFNPPFAIFTKNRAARYAGVSLRVVEQALSTGMLQLTETTVTATKGGITRESFEKFVADQWKFDAVALASVGLGPMPKDSLFAADEEELS